MRVGVRALPARSMMAFFWVAVVSMLPLTSADAASTPDWSGHWTIVLTCTQNGCTGSSNGTLDLAQTGVTITGTGTNTDDGQTFPITGTADGSSATLLAQANPISLTFYLTMSADGTTLTGTETSTDSSQGVTTTVGTLTGSRTLIAPMPSSTSATVAPTSLPVAVTPPPTTRPATSPKPVPRKGSRLPRGITIVVAGLGTAAGVAGAARGSKVGKRSSDATVASTPVDTTPVGKLGPWRTKDPSQPAQAWIKHPNDPEWYPAQPGTEFRRGDEIKADNNTIVSGEFVIGGAFGLRGQTQVTIVGERSIGGPAVEASERARALRQLRDQSGPVLVTAGVMGLVVLGPAAVDASIAQWAIVADTALTVGPGAAAPLVTGPMVVTAGGVTAIVAGTAQIVTTPAPPIHFTATAIKG